MVSLCWYFAKQKRLLWIDAMQYEYSTLSWISKQRLPVQSYNPKAFILILLKKKNFMILFIFTRWRRIRFSCSWVFTSYPSVVINFVQLFKYSWDFWALSLNSGFIKSSLLVKPKKKIIYLFWHKKYLHIWIIFWSNLNQ